MEGKRRRTISYFVLLGLGVFGIGLPAILPDGVPPDPNDPRQNPDEAIRIARENLAKLHWQLEERVVKKKLSAERQSELMVEEASQYADLLRTIGVRPSEAFGYGEVLRTARRWGDAATAFQSAVKHHRQNNEDLYINSLLRLAHCYAEEGRGVEAVETTRISFGASPGNKPSILLAVYLEIAPALLRHRYTEGVAEMIEDAMRQHAEAVVNPESTPGQMFLAARRFHLSKAAQLAAGIYEQKGEQGAADRVRQLVDKLIPESTPHYRL